MVRSFGDSGTEDVFHGRDTRRARQTLPAELWGIARRKLDWLNAAARLQDLQVPPGNRLEALKGKGAGWFSIRINRQYRIVFRWDDCAHEVTIVDYHS